MTQTSIDDSSTTAAGSGRICAVAAKAQRDLWKWTRRHGRAFAGIDAALSNSVCLASAFSAPWLTGDELRVTNRAALWTLAVASRGDEPPGGCLAVADGAPGEDDLTRSLADIRDELTPMPAFPVLRPVWREELRLLLGEPAGRPLGDLVTAGFCVTSHWISTAAQAPDPGAPGHPRLTRYLESQAEFWDGFARSRP